MSYSRQVLPEQDVCTSDQALGYGPTSSNAEQLEALRRSVMPGPNGFVAPGLAGPYENYLLNRAYSAGRNAPQVGYDGSLFRTVDTPYAATTLDWTYAASHGSEGRYNVPGEPLIYASESPNASAVERGAYKSMANQTMTEFNYQATPDPVTGKGGVADITKTYREYGFSEAQLATPRGQELPWYEAHQGTNKYTVPQTMELGAADGGASAIKVPSAAAAGDVQVDIIPRNTNPSQITPIEQVPYDAHGLPEPAVGPSGTKSMPADPNGRTTGMAEPADWKGSAKFGGIAGGLMALGTDVWRLANGEDLSAGQVLGDVAGGSGLGALSGVAFDKLVPLMGGGKLGMVKAGGVLEALTAGAFSTWNNAEAYGNGQVSASQATANVAVDAGIGLAAGATGAAIGAAIGSIIPGPGTALGAAVGFVGGMVGSWAVHALADHSGFTDWAKSSLGGALSGSEQSLAGVWDNLSSGQAAVSEGLATLGNGISSGLSSLWGWATGGSSTPGEQSDAASQQDSAAAAEGADAGAVDEVLSNSQSPAISELVETSEAADASTLVCDAQGLGAAELSSLSQSIDADDVADVASSLDADELASAAAAPEAMNVTQRVNVPGAERKVADAMEAG